MKFLLPGAESTTSGFIKSVQRHPLSGRAIHVDYLLVNLNGRDGGRRAARLHGEAPAVEETGGTLLHNLSSVRVKALPNDIPHEIERRRLGPRQPRRRDPRPRSRASTATKVQVLTDGETLVATVVPPRVEEEPEPVLAEGEELEGEAVEGEEGAEPTEGEGGAGGQPGEGGDSES